MNKPSRRAVVRTGVWTVPVVAAATAAPAMATMSGTKPPVTIEPVGAACKLPGHSTDYPYGYRMLVTFDNNTTTAVSVHLDSLAIDHKPVTGFPTGTDPNATFPISGSSSVTKLFIVFSSASSQRYATITYTVNGQTFSQDVNFPSFNPCKCDPKDADPGDPNSNCS